jgi:hypothetical protein
MHHALQNIWPHVRKFNADAREEVIRAFFSSTLIPTIPRGALPIYSLGT